MLINDGRNRFALDPRPFPRGRGSPHAADVDGDGDLDLLLIDVQQHRLLLNDGSGSFRDVTATHLPALGSASSAAFADFDADGDRDFVTAVAAAPGWRMFVNAGNGTFAAGPSLPRTRGSRACSPPTWTATAMPT